MIVVDTNVLSEVLRPSPEPTVASWLAGHGTDLVVTAMTVAELRYGAARLPEGTPRVALESAIESLLAALEVLPFGEREATLYASIRATREAVGIVVGPFDTLIAAIASAGDHAIATRNVKHFEGIGLTVLNPWTDS